MIKAIAIFINIILTSLYFFPFEFKALPGFNTKMMLALLGLFICGYEISRKRSGKVSWELFFLSVFAAVVSLCGLVSVILNGTYDYAYASYLVSMWVWLGGAYAVCYLLKQVHGRVDVTLLCNYLAAVCVGQCVMALWMDHNPAVKQVVDSIVEQGQEFLNSARVKRLYGIGAWLDVAGARFSAVLVLLAVVIAKEFRESKSHVAAVLYLVAFLLITVIGNMIARTTLVGVGLAFVYWIYDSGVWKFQLKEGYKVFFSWMALAIPVTFVVFAILYNTDPAMRKLLRFGFEGFFSLYETGTWEVDSNDKLRTMYVFPDNMKTWIMGDGYFANPNNTNPFYMGLQNTDFYMGTDVGYLRFIFYFGLIGLVAFIAFFIKACSLCMNRLATYKTLFFFLLLVNFTIWFKVATDIFLIFALFLMMPVDDNTEKPSLQRS